MIPTIKVDYSQRGQTDKHGGNKFWFLDLLELVQGFWHQPTVTKKEGRHPKVDRDRHKESSHLPDPSDTLA